MIQKQMITTSKDIINKVNFHEFVIISIVFQFAFDYANSFFTSISDCCHLILLMPPPSPINDTASFSIPANFVHNSIHSLTSRNSFDNLNKITIQNKFIHICNTETVRIKTFMRFHYLSPVSCNKTFSVYQ